MKRKEDALDIGALVRDRHSYRHIGERLGMDPRTVKKYALHPELSLDGRQSVRRSSKLDPFVGNVKAWLDQDAGLSAMWIYERLAPMGYAGGYEIVKRLARGLKAEHNQTAYLRFETEPGQQAQVDWGEFFVDQPDGTARKLYGFGMVLGYSRGLHFEFVERCDLTTFLDCHIHAFERYGGVPHEILYDRMKNVYIGKLAGKTVFNSSLTSLSLHYGFSCLVAPPFAPWVKGKIEQPIGFVREGFWRGYAFSELERCNRDVSVWLEMKSHRVHGTTHEVVRDRFLREQPTLGELPANRFDTSYRVYCSVLKDCCVHFEANRYMVPHTLVGKKLILRAKDQRLRIFHDDEIIVTYDIPEGKGHLVREQRFIDDLKQDGEMNRRKYERRGARSRKGHAKTISPSIPNYALEVELRPVQVYEMISDQLPPSKQEAA